MKFQEYLKKKEKINESREINEYSGDEATNVDFGLFSWGGGGELDNIAAGALAAGLILAKSMYNGIVYAKLKSSLPEYIEKYKLTQAPKSRTVYDEKYEIQKVDPLVNQKNELLGKGGDREDKDVERSSGEKTAKEKVEDYFRAAIDNAEGEDRKSNLRAKRDAALQKIDLKIQSLQNNIDTANDNKEVVWERMKDDWERFEEKFKKKEEGFIEVRDSILASSWRKKWDKEFKIAKAEADIQVLDEAQKIATERKNEKELDAIKNAKGRAERVKAEAQQAISEVTDDVDKAEAQQATLADLGVVGWMQTKEAYGAVLAGTYSKWKDIDEQLSGASQETDADALREKIAAAEKKLESGKKKAQEIRDSGDEETADKVDAALAKIEDDIASYKEELSKIGESFSLADSSLSLRVKESARMIDFLFEEEQEKRPTLNFAEVRKMIQKGVSNAPAEKKNELVAEAVKDIQNIRTAALNEAKAKNEMVDKIEKLKQQEDAPDLPEGSEVFTKQTKVDVDKEVETFDSAITDLKKQSGTSEPEDKPSPEPPGTAEEPADDTASADTEEIASVKKEIQEQKEKIDAINKKAKDPKSPLSNPEVLKKVVSQEEEKLKELVKKYREIQGESVEKKEESHQFAQDPGYVKFEEFLAMKNRK